MTSSSESEAAFTVIFNSSGVVEKGTQYQGYPNSLKLVGMHLHKYTDSCYGSSFRE